MAPLCVAPMKRVHGKTAPGTPIAAAANQPRPPSPPSKRTRTALRRRQMALSSSCPQPLAVEDGLLFGEDGSGKRASEDVDGDSHASAAESGAEEEEEEDGEEEEEEEDETKDGGGGSCVVGKDGSSDSDDLEVGGSSAASSCSFSSAKHSNPSAPGGKKKQIVAGGSASGASRAANGAAKVIQHNLKQKGRTGAGSDCSICTRPYTYVKLVNVGCAKYPQYRCRPCHNSARVLDRAARSQGPKAQQALTTLKKVKPLEWKRRICLCRVGTPDDPPLANDPSEVSDIKERFAASTKFITGLTATIEVETRRPVVWLNQRQFIGYYTTFEAMDKVEAMAKWDADSAEGSGVDRATENGVLTVAVKKPKESTIVQRVTRFRKFLESFDNDSDDKQSTIAKVKDLLKEMGLEELIKTNGDTALGEGRAAESTEFKKKEPQKGLTHGDLGSLPQCGSDEESVSLSLTQARTQAKNMSRRIIGTKFEKKSCDYNSLKELVAKLGDGHPEVKQLKTIDLLERFRASVDKLRVVKEKCPHWVESSFRKSYVDVLATVNDADATAASISCCLKQLKSVRLSQVQEDAGTRRRLALHLRKVLGNGALANQGFPKTCMQWLGTSALGVRSDKQTDFELTLDGALLNDPDEHWDFPLFTGSGKAGSISSVSLLSSCMGQRPSKTMAKLGKAKDKFGDDEFVLNCRLEPKPRKESYDQGEWVPALLSGTYAPQALATLAAPWVLYGRPWAFRFGVDVYPYYGIGSFIYGMSGTSMVILIPMAAMSEYEVGPSEVFTMLAGMSTGNATAFMEKNAIVIHVEVVAS